MAESQEGDKVPSSTINKILFFFFCFLPYYRYSCVRISPITGLANKRLTNTSKKGNR